MKSYQPDAAPNPADWLALDELERIRLVEIYHRKSHVKLPKPKAHAAVHAMVENQIAGNHEPVLRAMARLMEGGLSRHEAVHAVGSVLADFFFEASRSKDPHFGDGLQARYDAAMENLNVDEWCRKYES
jgi:hypothetical protein